jgi:hypothetical protein
VIRYAYTRRERRHDRRGEVGNEVDGAVAEEEVDALGCFPVTKAHSGGKTPPLMSNLRRSTSGPTVSCRLPFAGQKNTGSGFEDGDDVVGHEVHLVLTAFVGREFALVALVRELGDADPRLAVGLQREHLPSRFLVE